MKLSRGRQVSNRQKGTNFEIEVTNRLQHMGLDGSVLVQNLKLYSYGLNKETEIDRLLVTPWNIYAIEAKAFNTELVGNIEDRYWFGYSGAHATEIFNPVIQNAEHIRAINNGFRRRKWETFDIRNIVVIKDGCKASTNCPQVIDLSSLEDMITSDRLLSLRSGKPKLSVGVIEQMLRKLR